jgi:hypothetical protein
MIDFLNVKRISKPTDMGELMEVRTTLVIMNLLIIASTI